MISDLLFEVVNAAVDAEDFLDCKYEAVILELPGTALASVDERLGQNLLDESADVRINGFRGSMSVHDRDAIGADDVTSFFAIDNGILFHLVWCAAAAFAMKAVLMNEESGSQLNCGLRVFDFMVTESARLLLFFQSFCAINAKYRVVVRFCHCHKTTWWFYLVSTKSAVETFAVIEFAICT